MAVQEVQLVSRQGTSAPATVSLDANAIAANLFLIDRRLTKAGLPALRPLFEPDDQTWHRCRDVLSTFETARQFFIDADSDEILFEVVVKQFSATIDVLKAIPKDSAIRFEVIKSKPRKLTDPKPARTKK